MKQKHQTYRQFCHAVTHTCDTPRGENRHRSYLCPVAALHLESEQFDKNVMAGLSRRQRKSKK
jgi:hypothetical protein